MVKKVVSRKNSNFLPLLAVSVFALSFGVISYTVSSNSNNSQSVLSESAENPDYSVNSALKNSGKAIDNGGGNPASPKADVKPNASTDPKTGSKPSAKPVATSRPPVPLTFEVKTVSGKTLLTTDNGPVEVKNTPQDAIDGLVDSKVIDNTSSFKITTNDNNEVEYTFEGSESKKLFGLFSISIPKKVTVSADTGSVVSTDQSTWSKLLNVFSN